MKKLTLLFALGGCLLATAPFVKAGASIPDGAWKAHWINTERCQSQTNTWLAYRKTVNIENVPQQLVARIAADSKYWLWINGKLVVFEGGLKRGPSPYDTYYDKVEIAPYLTAGENTIAVLVWHFGKSGFNHVNSGLAALLFEAIAPGIEIISDKSWQCCVYDAYQNTEAPHPNFRLPESNIRFDANKEMRGWNLPDFSGSFSSAEIIGVVGKAPLGRLVERPIPLVKDYGLKPYVNIRKSVAGDTLYCRLPYNCQVTPYLKVEAKGGDTIRIQTDNYRGGSENNVRAEYITRSGIQEYESYGWMNGNEMQYTIPKGVNVLDVQFRETGYNAEFEGSFSCNDPFFNELWKRSARTLYITMRDNYMDCPDRERAQWWGDEVNELGEAFYALSTSGQKLALKGIYELVNWQREDGVLYSPVPAANWTKELPLQMLASVGWYGFYTQYYYSGDSSFVASVYDRVHRYLHEVWQVDKSGLALERDGDWSWGDWGENIDMGVLTNCWYYLALKAEKAFAVQLGKIADAEKISNMMYSIEECFDTKFWTGDSYRSPGYKGETDDRAQAMAVLSGLASKDKYPALLKVLKKEYHASPYMEKYVLEALFEMGQPAFALERMKQRYTKMMNYTDYTTLFEGWGIGAEGFGGGTINHAWSGGPLTLLSQKVCGIEPTSPGFKTFKIKPALGTLTNAEASVPTHYGDIKVKLQKSGRNIVAEITVPENTSAEFISGKGKVDKLSSGSYVLKRPF
ncbi:alpha-L-rhamnosidase C-terminal domain-containing protein [Parabacteroides sp. AM08-6]|uniref:alpha-L-rhamnosidase-related protein n=1 Tax=Parabacteroides sp. AM08-6 TaxID=2292053 RepID=UPI000EFE2ADE|nr:alpha-L-rhamnosidase C-terminal domain-containing protein [Parabacteroides sp. AM08-6]RHJ87807.1 glycoside hydrolase [Parabacteroides sp. AM08-6]